jgi:hypothetical protein
LLAKDWKFQQLNGDSDIIKSLYPVQAFFFDNCQNQTRPAKDAEKTLLISITWMIKDHWLDLILV